MRQSMLAFAFTLLSASSSAGQSGAITATLADGGSVVTELGHNIKVNEGSSLRRSWVVLNDPACSVQLEGTGVATVYAERDRGYRFEPRGKLKATSASRAFEVRYLLFDMFGNHIKTLSGAEVRDLASASDLDLATIGSWRASENEASELLTVVGFVAYARTADGKVWRHNEKAIGAELTRIQLQVKSGILEPTKQQ